jgi:DNA-binding LytR/AlgR family response regulator
VQSFSPLLEITSTTANSSKSTKKMNTTPSPAKKFSFLMVNHKLKLKIPIYKIIMLEGHKNYTLIYLDNGKTKLYARTLSRFEDQLNDEHFIRCHRAYLVNPAFIIGYDKEACKLYLENNLTANISRRKHGRLNTYL